MTGVRVIIKFNQRTHNDLTKRLKMPQTNNKGGTFHGICRVWFGITQGDLHIPIPKDALSAGPREFYQILALS